MRLTKFGLVDLPEANGQDALPVNVRSNVIDLQYGGVDLDGNNAVLRPNVLRRQAVFTENIQTNQKALFKELAKGARILRGKEIDNTDYLTFGKGINLSFIPDARRYGCEQAIALDLMQVYPYWLLSADAPFYLDDDNDLDDGLSLDSGNKSSLTISYPSVSDTVSIDNTGDTEIRNGYIVFSVAATGDWEISDLRVTNTANGLNFIYESFSGNGNSGEATINWLAKSVLDETSTLDHSQITLPPKQSDWFRLEVGDNDIDVSFEIVDGEPDLSIDFYWSRQYLY